MHGNRKTETHPNQRVGCNPEATSCGRAGENDCPSAGVKDIFNLLLMVLFYRDSRAPSRMRDRPHRLDGYAHVGHLAGQRVGVAPQAEI